VKGIGAASEFMRTATGRMRRFRNEALANAAIASCAGSAA
jgi:hypothetical protein